MRALLNSLYTWAGLTEPVRYALLTKLCQLAALPVTILLISTHFLPETQGYYYTFFSLIALQSFLELGLHTVVLNVVSHETTHAQVGEKGGLTGDADTRARILGLGRLVLRWYSIGGFLFLVLGGAGGVAFFAASNAAYGAWVLPWLTLVLIASIQFVVSPINYLLEGLGQVGSIARMRWLTMLANTLATWALIYAGVNLWTAVGSAAAILIVNVWFLLAVFPRFFQQLAESAETPIDWRHEIWPLQWRIAIQGAVNYLFYSLFNPVLFHYHGPAEAGRFGMTLQILGGIQTLSLAWLQAVVPQFGRLVALRRFGELEAVWGRATTRVVVASLIGNLALIVAVPVMGWITPEFAGRLANPVSVTLLALAHWFLVPVFCMAAYLRGFKREPMTWISFVSGVSCGCLVWFSGMHFGAVGAASAFLGVTVIILLPGTIVIWMKARRRWIVKLSI
jgi:Na+-driven multidrug efflux pump